VTRLEEISHGLEQTRARIADACSDANRPADSVTLTVVTKYFPVSDIGLLARLGVTDVGENRHQEAVEKHAQWQELGQQVGQELDHELALRWHFIGQLQRNKAHAVAGYADVVESVDSVRLAEALSRGAVAHDRVLDCLVQVGLDPSAPPGRGGARPDEVPAICAAIEAAPALRLRGVMAVAPLEADPSAAFAALAEVSARVRAEHPTASWVSAGMSGDLEQAISAGATHVRVGSAILGSRPPLG
jgi:hypothetical protein